MRDQRQQRRWRDQGWDDRPWSEGDEEPDRGRMYEQSTGMGGYGQQGWQGGYSQPAPGQGGQQQDYRQQQRWGQGSPGDQGRFDTEGRGYGESWGQGRRMGRGRGVGRGVGRGEGQFRGRGPKGYVRSDERIRENVSDRLSDDSWVDASDIEVTVAEAVVALDGTVADRDQKRRAEDVAADVPGVHDVDNRLRVRRDDETVLDKIGNALTGAADRPSEG